MNQEKFIARNHACEKHLQDTSDKFAKWINDK